MGSLISERLLITLLGTIMISAIAALTYQLIVAPVGQPVEVQLQR